MNNYKEISMDDIIFENRNKQYGAYQLRQSIDRHSGMGLLATLSAFSLLLLLYSIHPFHKNIKADPIIEVNFKPSDIPEYKPEIEQQKQTTPPPQTKVNTTEFKDMKVIDDAVVTTTNIATQTDIFDKQIGTETITDGIDKTNTIIAEKTSGTGTEIVETVADKKIESDKIVNFASEMPMFAGGKDAMMEYLSKNIKPFSSDVENGISGKVIIRFYIDIDGTVKNPEILKDNIGGRCAEAAIAAIKKMPKWKAGKQNGIPVKVYFTLPVTFNFSRN